MLKTVSLADGAMVTDKDEIWIAHLKHLAEDNANLRIIVRTLRIQVTALQDNVDHYQREFARQNAKIITMTLHAKVEECSGVKAHDSMSAIEECGSNHDGV